MVQRQKLESHCRYINFTLGPQPSPPPPKVGQALSILHPCVGQHKCTANHAKSQQSHPFLFGPKVEPPDSPQVTIDTDRWWEPNLPLERRFGKGGGGGQGSLAYLRMAPQRTDTGAQALAESEDAHMLKSALKDAPMLHTLNVYLNCMNVTDCAVQATVILFKNTQIHTHTQSAGRSANSQLAEEMHLYVCGEKTGNL